MKQIKDDIARLIGLTVAGLVVIGAIFLGVYALLGAMDNNAVHVLATVLVFGVFIAYALGLQVAKAHRVGLEHGVDLKLSARERTVAIRPAPQVTPQWDDLLPRQSAAIVQRHAGDMNIVDM